MAFKEGCIVAGKLSCHIHAVGENGLGDLALQAGREAGKALCMGRDDVPVHPGLVEKALLPACGDNFEQVAEAVLVAGKQDEVIAALCRIRGGVKAIGSHIDFTAEDGLETVFLAGFLELACTEHIAMVCDGAG